MFYPTWPQVRRKDDVLEFSLIQNQQSLGPALRQVTSVPSSVSNSIYKLSHIRHSRQYWRFISQPSPDHILCREENDRFMQQWHWHLLKGVCGLSNGNSFPRKVSFLYLGKVEKGFWTRQQHYDICREYEYTGTQTTLLLRRWWCRLPRHGVLEGVTLDRLSEENWALYKRAGWTSRNSALFAISNAWGPSGWVLPPYDVNLKRPRGKWTLRPSESENLCSATMIPRSRISLSILSKTAHTSRNGVSSTVY